MSKQRSQQGFTLLGFIITMSLVISLVSGAGVLLVEHFGERGATKLGVRMAEYNGAVGRYIQEHITTITSNATYSGISWLQNTSCGGSADSDYLPCTYSSALPFDLSYQTAITVAGPDITATITYGPNSMTYRGRWRLDLAESARGRAIENQVGGLRLSQDFILTGANILQSTVSTVGATEPWLRIDGSNSPTADIDWNNHSITNLDCVDFGDGSICTNGAGYMTVTATGDVRISDNLFVNNITANGFYGGNVYSNDVWTNRDISNESHTRILYDRDNYTYRVDPSGTSRMNYADLNYARLQNDYTEGAGCITEMIGTTNTGELMSCVNGRWARPGGIVRVAHGTVIHNAYVSPITGFTRAQCVISLSGVPYKNDGGYKRSRHYSLYHVDSGAGWLVRAGSRAISDNLLRGVTNAIIQYQLVCSR